MRACARSHERPGGCTSPPTTTQSSSSRLSTHAHNSSAPRTHPIGSSTGRARGRATRRRGRSFLLLWLFVRGSRDQCERRRCHRRRRHTRNAPHTHPTQAHLADEVEEVDEAVPLAPELEAGLQGRVDDDLDVVRAGMRGIVRVRDVVGRRVARDGRSIGALIGACRDVATQRASGGGHASSVRERDATKKDRRPPQRGWCVLQERSSMPGARQGDRERPHSGSERCAVCQRAPPHTQHTPAPARRAPMRWLRLRGGGRRLRLLPAGGGKAGRPQGWCHPAAAAAAAAARAAARAAGATAEQMARHQHDLPMCLSLTS